ncbi:MAG: hypothetical protein ACE5KZ_06190 [Candidatus Scalinduaceae bacterium]
MKKMKISISYTFLILLFSYTINAEEKDYCNDPDVNAKWEALVEQYPDDMGLHALHALRLGLCLKVGLGDISIDEAKEIFGNVRKAFIDRKVDDLLEESNEQEKGL